MQLSDRSVAAAVYNKKKTLSFLRIFDTFYDNSDIFQLISTFNFTGQVPQNIVYKKKCQNATVRNYKSNIFSVSRFLSARSTFRWRPWFRLLRRSVRTPPPLFRPEPSRDPSSASSYCAWAVSVFPDRSCCALIQSLWSVPRSFQNIRRSVPSRSPSRSCAPGAPAWSRSAR